jgi:hypothetical protein
MSFASAPGRSRNGPVRCPPNSPRSTRSDASPMPFPGLEAIAFRVARIVAALAKRGDAVADRVYNGPIRWN